MSTIKFYTESQVEEVLSKAWIPSVMGVPLYKGSELLESLTPIELPSDEEIENIAEKTLYVSMNGFIAGAKWMKEQILNQNK